MNCILHIFKMIPGFMNSNNIQALRELKLSDLQSA